MAKKKKNHKSIKLNFNQNLKIKKLSIYSSFIFLFLILFPGSILAYEKMFDQKIYPGVKVGDLNLENKTKSQALEIIRAETQKIANDGLNFFYQNKKITVNPFIISPTDPDLNLEILTFHEQETVEEAYNIARDQKFFENLKTIITILFNQQKLKAKYSLNREELKKILKTNFQQFEKPAENAKLKIAEDNGKFLITVIPEKEGFLFNYDLAIEQAENNLSVLQNNPISLSTKIDLPKIKKEDVKNFENQILKILSLKSIILKNEEKNWEIDKEKIINWLDFQFNETEGITLGFNENLTKNFLQSIANEINIPPQNARFQIQNGKVSEFQSSQEGKELDIETSYQTINNEIKKLSSQVNLPESVTILLTIKKTTPQITIDEINNLGIKELVGRGESNFAGSPPNRRHNIKVGAEKLNGILIKPGETFSTNQALGEISAATGFLPELVIKGDRTIPEYGGGLCQIGTTMFRLALDTGLPIIERKPHSYRVVYYEPAGMDATIYSPHPDLKFINDTPAYLLLQTKIEGDNLIFEFWGTSDGRKVTLSKPKIYNLVSPGPTKIIETEDLPPGSKKCIERAHTGADAEFTRTITYANGEIKTEVWKSHYVPWSAVCLVGKEPTPETPPAEESQSNETSPESPSPTENPTENVNINLNTNFSL